jgi:hypothetical protein
VAPPSSKLRAWFSVGAGFFERTCIDRAAPPPLGIVDDVSVLSRRGLDATRIHPDVVAFFERTGDLELLIVPDWQPGFRNLVRLYRWLADRIGQLRPPLRRERIRTLMVPLLEGADGRPGARGVLRLYQDGSAMQVLSYAVHQRAGTGYLSVAFPFPCACLLGVLRLDAIGEDAAGRLSVELTSERRDGDEAGVWAVVGPLRVRLPLGETMKIWSAAGEGHRVDAIVLPGSTVVSLHEQRLFGRPVVRFTYWLRPRAPHSRHAGAGDGRTHAAGVTAAP